MYGIYDEDTGDLVEPGIVHMQAKEVRHWRQKFMREAEEARPK